MTAVQGITLLGSTGSIGKNTLDVLSRHPDRYRVHALSANTSVDTMLTQCEAWLPRYAVMQDADAASRLEQLITGRGLETIVLQGTEALQQIARDAQVQIVVAAIVGAAGLMPTLAAAASGKRLLLANKEALVMSGQLLTNAATRSGALLMPVDSEHNAIFQCLPVTGSLTEKQTVSLAGVTKILLTASGGPFRKSTLDEMRVVTPQQALKHPNWSMGRKITIDSATLMNKGLEVIEACHLFAIDIDHIEVVVHPESVVHSMVSYRDGSVLAQLGQPDMRTPIANALAWPERIDAGVPMLDLTMIAGLHFEKPDLERFPCLRLAFAAQRQGGTAPTVLNAANEVAVEAFLSGSVAFLQLPEIVEYTLLQAKISPADDLATIIDADAGARQLAHTHIHSLHR